MITPVFEITQEENFIILRLRVPHLKVSSFDFYIEEDTFKFSGKPYFLRLIFPSPLIEDGSETASYNIDTGILTLNLPKKNKGEQFQDLDFLTLLKTKNDEGNKNKKIPAISVIESLENNKSIEELDNSDSEEEVEIDWEFPQTLPGASAASVLLNSHPFGFSLQQTDYFNDLRDEIEEIMELGENPAQVSLEERRKRREEMENEKFDMDHYMADFMQSDDILPLIQFNLFSQIDENDGKIDAENKYLTIPTESEQISNKKLTINTSENKLLLNPSSSPFIFPPTTIQALPILEPVPAAVISSPAVVSSVPAAVSPDPTNSEVSRDSVSLPEPLTDVPIAPVVEDPSQLIVFAAKGEEKEKEKEKEKEGARGSPGGEEKKEEEKGKEGGNAQGGREINRFNVVEREMIRNLPNRSYLLETNQNKEILLNLFDILFAYCYDARTTMLDPTVESSWTIVTLSSIFSFADSFKSLYEVVRSSIRRSLIYPLYRNWELSMKVYEDTVFLFSSGKRRILKALLATKRILQFSEFRNHFNKLYVDDYCVWIQSLNNRLISSLSKQLKELKLNKAITGWNLLLIEETAEELAEEDDLE